MPNSSELTTIGVTPETKDRLKELRPFDSMTQEETLNLMLDVYEKQRRLRFMSYRKSAMMSLSESNENGGSN